MNVLSRLLVSILLTTSVYFGNELKLKCEYYGFPVQVFVRNALNDQDLDVEITWNEESIKILNQIFTQRSRTWSISGIELLAKGYKSDFKSQLRVGDGMIFPVGGTYRCFKYFQVAIKKIAPGSLIKKEQLEVVRAEYAKKQNVVTNQDAVVGMEALQKIEPGVPIPLSSLAQPVVVKAGSTVDVIVCGRKVPYKDACITLESGRWGDIIRCRSLKTRKVCIGVAFNSKQVLMFSNKHLMETFESARPKECNSGKREAK